MKKVELKSFIRSILLFFISLSILISLLYQHIYEDKVQTHQNALYTQMQIASLNLRSNIFNIDFISKTQDKQLYKMLRDNQNIYANFEIFGSNQYLLKTSYPLKSLDNDITIIKNDIFSAATKAIFIAFVLSIIFSLYALYPLKQFLNMTNEFIKDILHDFNTPISSIRLNVDLLEDKNTKAVHRIKGGIENILNLQNNLKNYIDDEVGESQEFDLAELISKRVEPMKDMYPHVEVSAQIDTYKIKCNEDGFVRIIDNIISNACKYNKKDGKVIISLSGNILEIKDSGIGIKKPQKIFDRFYKETSRGLGIGLHIVDKLATKMKIKISVNSKINQGTSFFLDLSKLTLL